MENPTVYAMPLEEINLFNSREIFEALTGAADLLVARVEAIELQLLEVLSLFDAPLSKDERIERIREIRESLSNASTET